MYLCIELLILYLNDTWVYDDEISIVWFAAPRIEVLSLWSHEVIHEEVPGKGGNEQGEEPC